MRVPPEGLKNRLIPALEEIGKYGMGKLLGEYPGFLARLLNKLKEGDAAGLFNQVPGAADKFTDLLWEGVSSRAGQSKDLKSVLEESRKRPSRQY